MTSSLKVLIIGLFIGLFIINLIFRAKVLKAYKYLIKNDISFSALDALSKRKLQQNIIPRYPNHREEIMKFVQSMKTSIFLSIGVIVLILVLALTYRFVF